jgi:carboxyl-terminal processing protease
MRHRFSVILVLVVLLSSLMGGFLGGNAAANPGSTSQTSGNDFLANYTEALDIIQNNYVDKIDPDKLVYSSIKGMLRVLDPHSTFFDPKEFSKLREEQHGKYYGLGIKVRALIRDRGKVVIIEPPFIGSPAERRGLRVGDVIAKIEGESIDDWTSDEVVSHLRGPRGTTVNITVERPGIHDPMQFAVERDEIPLVTVQYAFEIKPGIGYVKIDRFSETTSDELRAKVKALNVSQLSGLILDLRDNPGGLLNQAIEVSDFFLPHGSLVVSTKGRAAGSARKYPAPSFDTNLDKIKVPMVILINKHSASASEIVAGALQDHDRALIVGETSFGKGLVQSVYTLENETGMALTTAKYYTPSGRLIQRDYSGSITEYYYMDGASVPSAENNANREIKSTDSGRKVYGGGGITPDVTESMKELNRFEALLVSKEVFFQYGRRLTSGQVPGAKNFEVSAKKDGAGALEEKGNKPLPNLEISNSILDDFKAFLKERKIDFTESDINSNIDFIKKRIKNEAYISLFGLQEGYKAAIQLDSQVIKALEVMPEAKMLMSSGRLASPATENRKH